jgi:hypothetical protein
VGALQTAIIQAIRKVDFSINTQTSMS